MNEQIQTICVLITCVIAVAGILIYLGRQLNAIQQISDANSVLFKRTDKHGEDITRIDKELTKVITRQEDCEACP